jgi:hypothetical protein
MAAAAVEEKANENEGQTAEEALNGKLFVICGRQEDVKVH